MNSKSQFLIAAVASGSGKTTLSLGLLRLLRNKGWSVQPFKCGPDYIDTKFHEMASNQVSVNLDTFLSSREHVRSIYHRYGAHKDVTLVEGVMGLFDGYDKMKGSSAEMALLLDIPVILVVNAQSMAYSMAALLSGFKNWNPALHIAGVIFNFVGSESHYEILKEAAHEVGLKSFGYLPKQLNMKIPSRHLGLSLDRSNDFDLFAETVAEAIDKYVDVRAILEATLKENTEAAIQEKRRMVNQKLRIAVALDEAFNFTYTENIRYLEALGTVSFFSPLADKKMPAADFVYLPGGYPEIYLEPLSRNISMKESIRQYVDSDGRVLAECGGMMYLSTSITDSDGNEFPMVGVFEQKASMENMQLKLGYRRFQYKDLQLSGHEFHYSDMKESQLQSIVQQFNAKKQAVDTSLIRYKNAIGGYTHLYWAELENFMQIFEL
jgi:cobyrinic acid a,c-diamide synthase